CGYAAEDPVPAGFVFGFLGIHDYHFRHHSHMLAVRDPYRGSGLAQQLKEAQRDHCLDQGIEIVAWTMDPLEARNARFNFGKLGAYTRTYYRDFYGARPDKSNQGLPAAPPRLHPGHGRAMKLERVELFVVRLPLKNAYETSGARETHMTRVLCRVESEGAVGWGESVAGEVPWYSGETARTVLYALEE